MTDMTHEQIEQLKAVLEQAVDTYGLGCVLDALAEIASEKCEHVNGCYSDIALANAWHDASLRIAALATEVTI